MVDTTNPDAVDFENWAAPAIEDDIPMWKVRRLAVELTHIADDSKAISE